MTIAMHVLFLSTFELMFPDRHRQIDDLATRHTQSTGFDVSLGSQGLAFAAALLS
jgi:hypothetical protein